MLVQCAVCADESLLEHQSSAEKRPVAPHQSPARSTDCYFVVAAVPVFARLGAHHVCIPELCPWIDLHAALFVTSPVTLGRANLPTSAWSPPDAQSPATGDQSRDLPSRWGRCASRSSLQFSTLAFGRTVRLIDSSCHSLCIVPFPAHMAV